MRVLHVTPSFYPAVAWGGPITALYALCNALALRTEVNLKVLTTDSASPLKGHRLATRSFPERYRGYDVYFCHRWYGNEVAPKIFPMLSELVRWSDVVHLTATYSFPTIPTLVACRILRKPVVWSPRGALQVWESKRRRRTKMAWNAICRSLLPKAFTFHCTSDREAAESVETFGGGTAVVIPNGVEIPSASKQHKEGNLRPRRILFLGLISPKKGLDCIIDAMKLLPEDRYHLDVYGSAAPGYQQYCEDMARSTTASNVRFHGFVDGERKARAFLEADICVVPSHSENFCNVVAEALSYGVPVVASRGVPWPELETFGCGLWVDNHPASLASAIVSLEKRSLETMGGNGRRWMQEHFSWTGIANRMCDHYVEVLKDG